MIHILAMACKLRRLLTVILLRK